MMFFEWDFARLPGNFFISDIIAHVTTDVSALYAIA